LCSYPSALFDSSLLFREVDKPALADAIWKACECEAPGLGCDTTSRLYGIGKGISLSKFKASSMFHEQAKVFNSDSASTCDEVDAGEKALILVYNGKLTDTLYSFRHKRFCEKVATKTSHAKPQSLPPTSAAAKYQSLRVYLQVLKNGKDLLMNFIQQTGGGRSVKRSLCHFKHLYLLLLNICCG